MKGNESGASEVVDETLIIALGIVLAVITVMLVTGVIPLTPKSAYLVPQFNIVNASDKPVIAIFHRAGDPVYFNAAPSGEYTAELQVDTQAGSFKAVPAPALTAFRPGDWIVLYYTGSGFMVTPNLSGASFSSLPPGKITVRFIDTKSGVLIAKEDVVAGTGSLTATVTPTPTATTRATTTATTSPTTTSTASTTITTSTASTTSTTPTSSTTATTTITSATVTTTTTSVTAVPTCTPGAPRGQYVSGHCPCDDYARSRSWC
ncbi:MULTISPECIES: hypothetical protein [unclassified Methanoregula]|uniref:hypothetical protein n=1 Tax=unclassified Methanoregula TaxID=2649730 RepID=UPI0009D0E6E7|nr:MULTISPECIES: hypothetical protein [unclassified Methanoregula]OPX64132.1 MAG: hypothetical protein A4E33_01156 [Methanoregula sp. PtaB.Bin085]OPY34748.1 MAG: hypothetical protein A4E34_01277 [Methanoregula sp. PtaU1.Bin006]